MRIIPEKHDREKLIVMKTWEQLFEEADRGDIKALELCTSYCIQGDDETSPDLSKALHYALLIEENGGDSSPYFTWIYTLQKDYKHAYHAYKVAFMRGHLEQMGEMALVCYHLGKFEEAYQYAGNTKEWQGAFVLGLLYENGNYVAANREMAHTYYSRAYRISNDPAAGEGMERTRSMAAPATSHVFRNLAIFVSVLIVIITAGVLIDNNAKREKAKRLAQQEREKEEQEKKENEAMAWVDKEQEDALSNYVQGKPVEKKRYNNLAIFQGGDSSSSSSSYSTDSSSSDSSDSYSTYENSDEDYEDYDYDDEDYYEEDDSSSEYIFPYSDTECLTAADVKGLSATEINLAKNELYARHGRIFDRQDLQQYFESCSWYYGEYTRTEWEQLGDDYFFNATEIKNRNLLVKYEKKAK